MFNKNLIVYNQAPGPGYRFIDDIESFALAAGRDGEPFVFGDRLLNVKHASWKRFVDIFLYHQALTRPEGVDRAAPIVDYVDQANYGDYATDGLQIEAADSALPQPLHSIVIPFRDRDDSLRMRRLRNHPKPEGRQLMSPSARGVSISLIPHSHGEEFSMRRKTLWGAAALMFGLAIVAATAEAGWHSFGSFGGYGSAGYGYGSAGYGYASGGGGFFRGRFHGHHHYRACYRGHASYGSYGTGFDSIGGLYGSYGGGGGYGAYGGLLSHGGGYYGSYGGGYPETGGSYGGTGMGGSYGGAVGTGGGTGPQGGLGGSAGDDGDGGWCGALPGGEGGMAGEGDLGGAPN